MAALALAGCAGSDASPPPAAAPPPERTCDASPAQGFVGEKASAATGARILAETGARTLRWGPPDSAFTMDYREDRVNVMYDADMAIERITCG
ncbi:I78 family peptidase inhibitor [Erythrobacter sp. HL-111]|uniref:I78 family peptidase inhibitor n=1 Tax=Erythrobacter sp. HL-111 TaxID=1798193 RepID=UPI0006DB8EE9|nr:I78 family peptidase inhibitor [Erythrobacter sp. HL-111]KPP91148.1 MAG: Peptidase inhibitor I78 family [Erythrobacteraceae bacterium HL-111]SDS45810.1 Peptidase inhibitor I78 family protein [Erythrobacter sp. HL-111]